MCATVLLPLLVLFLQASPLTADEEPLHTIIDRYFAESVSSVCSDAQFQRRVSLDLIGMHLMLSRSVRLSMTRPPTSVSNSSTNC